MKIVAPSAETSVQESCWNSRTIETPPASAGSTGSSGDASDGAEDDCAGARLSSWIVNAGPSDTPTFLKLTGATGRAATVAAGTARCSGRAIRPRTTRIPVTLATIVPAAPRRPRKRDRNPRRRAPEPSRDFSGATSAR